MLISTRGRYALRVMIDLAEHRSDGFIPLKLIAKRQEISEKYLESIIKTLVKSHLLNGLRGKGGGYQLTRDPEEYSVGDIFRLMEESLFSCPEHPSSLAEYRIMPLWQGLAAYGGGQRPRLRSSAAAVRPNGHPNIDG